MCTHLRLFILILATGLVFRSAQAEGPPTPDPKPDYSKEAFVIEQSSTKIAFENDGTGTRESSGRIHVQSDAGIQRFGLLTFAYQNSTESVDIDYVRVQKPDGTSVATPSDNIQDMATEITREAPFYSDLREKHIAVKGLSVGDVLEFHVRWHSTKPLAPGEFWYAYNFSRESIILSEQLQISLPRGRLVKWKSPEVKPVIAEEGARRVFTWTSSELEHKSSEQEKSDQDLKLYQAARGQLPSPDVVISSFQSWEEVGRWYGDLQQERVKPSPEIRAKALELTKGATDDNAKLRTIYKYVSTEFRYIGIAFGIGRYQPHTAAEVLANQYGDCKDKQTLLASLLDAVGIKAYPALINASHEIDVDVPSPGQFDHVIGMVPQPSGSVWLDTTPEVAPFAHLLRPLRNKNALVIPDNKSPTLMVTPAAPPSKLSQTFKINAKLGDTGTLEGKVELTIQGDDSEVLLRSAFRRVPMPQWKDLIQQISYGSGFAGEVSEVTASSPENTDEPFHFAYSYTRKDYPDWSERRISSPLPPMVGVTSDSKPSHPIFLGETGEFQYESRVQLPKGYWPALPDKVDLKEDYAEYHASYTGKDGVLTTERRFVIKLCDVPAGEYDAFKKFAKAVADDHEAYAALNSSSPPENSIQDAISRLPDTDNADATQAFADAMSDAQGANMPGAVASLNQALAADPHFARAWVMLAGIYVRVGQSEMALETLRKARDNNPDDATINRGLVSALMEQGQYEEAVSVLEVVVKSEPANGDIFSALGSALFVLKRYSEAADAVESAIKLTPDRARLYSQLGSIYLHGGKQDKARKAFEKAVELDSTPVMLNDVGYEMADANQNLPLSLDYAQRAVRAEEESTAQISLDDLTEKDLQRVSVLAAYWDTLGWVYFRLENLDKAEKYLNAAWTISQSALIGDHLGQVYEQQHKKDQAVRMYRLALVASPKLVAMKDTQSRLERLGGTVGHGRLDSSGREELGKLRTVRLSPIMTESATGEFFLLFGARSKVQEVKFVSGSEKLKSADKALSGAPFDVPLPDDGPTRLIRRGVLSCSPISGCIFVLYTPDVVRSVH
jgi:tetratricopeptide (TPR) repeat protein/transglutaminase-like putative cysteine protease